MKIEEVAGKTLIAPRRRFLPEKDGSQSDNTEVPCIEKE